MYILRSNNMSADLLNLSESEPSPSNAAPATPEIDHRALYTNVATTSRPPSDCFSSDNENAIEGGDDDDLAAHGSGSFAAGCVRVGPRAAVPQVTAGSDRGWLIAG